MTNRRFAVEKNRQKKIAVINDLSGYGRCSLSVIMPIISSMKIQCCPVITSILSNHTGYSHCFKEDFTKQMPEYISHWKKIGMEFDGILTGYLGSKEQIDIVIDFIHSFSKNTIVVVDPVMGDHGKIYRSFTKEHCYKMKELAKYAHILTPNITEACILTDTEYKDTWELKELEELSIKLQQLGPHTIIITGIQTDGYLNNYVKEGSLPATIIKEKQTGHNRPGTGDIFTSIVTGAIINKYSIIKKKKKASNFVKNSIERSEEWNIPIEDGVCFEEFLHTL